MIDLAGACVENTALLLESVSSLRLRRTHKLRISKCFEHALVVDTRASFFSRVFQFVVMIRTDFRVSKVFQAALVENTQALPISVCDEHALVRNTLGSRQKC